MPPYGGGLLMVIYLTFIKPTVAAFVIARIAWGGLLGGRVAKISWSTLLILAAPDG